MVIGNHLGKWIMVLIDMHCPKIRNNFPLHLNDKIWRESLQKLLLKPNQRPFTNGIYMSKCGIPLNDIYMSIDANGSLLKSILHKENLNFSATVHGYRPVTFWRPGRDIHFAESGFEDQYGLKAVIKETI
jgi:hypothetical protein